MNVAFVGCGYVFDIYMRTKWAHPELKICGVFDIDTQRSSVVRQHYNLKVYETLQALLSDQAVEIVINLTSIRSHYEIIEKSLQAGKHVYTEKPITLNMTQTQSLFREADARKLILSGAPCNVYSDAIATIFQALKNRAIGKPVLIYAELDDSPAHLMQLETVRSPTGAPFPYVEELQEGCTVEHVGYHLAWICAYFGPVISLTACSHWLVANKTETPLSPSDTPDLSVACLTLPNGVTARLTCSWVAPRDHSFRIVGEEGEISCDNVFHDQSPVTLERFSRVSLTARKAFSLRYFPSLGRAFGIRGRRIKLVRRWKSHAVEAERGVGTSLKHKIVSRLRRREVYAQDKFLGVAEMVRSIRNGLPQPTQPDFLIHLNELTLLIQNAGAEGIAVKPTTTFQKQWEELDCNRPPIDYLKDYRQKFLEGRMASILGFLHK